MAADEPPFWKTKSLEQMTDSEWESLCDGCGRCCLVKLEDADDKNRTYFTDVGCRLLDGDTCRCADYPNRTKKVPDCVRLTPKNVRKIVWLPPTCGYRLVADGRDLYWWHPLVSGDPDTVHTAGISVQGKVGAEEDAVRDEELEDRIVQWPVRIPKKARKAPGVFWGWLGVFSKLPGRTPRERHRPRRLWFFLSPFFCCLIFYWGGYKKVVKIFSPAKKKAAL